MNPLGDMIWILDWTPSNNQIPSKKCFEKMYEKRENERTTTNFDFASQIDRSIKHFNTFFVWNHVLWHDIRVWIGESRLKLPIVLTTVCANSCEFHWHFPLFFEKNFESKYCTEVDIIERVYFCGWMIIILTALNS